MARARHAEDRRVVSTRITPEGVKLLQSVDLPMVEIHKKQFDFLSSVEMQALLDQLMRIREALD